MSMKWPKLRDIFAFRLPVGTAAIQSADDDFATGVDSADSPSDPEQVRWQKIRFDNTIRLWVSIPTYLVCIVLWAGGAMSDLIPITAVFSVYIALEFVVLTTFFNLKSTRPAEFLLSGLDLIAMSFSIYYTGGVASPLYFIYFVPLIVHAFHRDWGIILFNGFGGVILYGVAVLLSLSEVRAAALTDLAARLVCMLLTIAIACLALNLLRRKDEADRHRLVRVRAAATLTHRLNHACAVKELPSILGDLESEIAAAIGGMRQVHVRTLLREGTSQLRACGSQGFSTSIHLCPATVSNGGVTNHQLDGALECHWEASARSRLCVPISISDAEIFGVMSVGSMEAGPFSEEDQRFVRFVSRSIALCAHRLRQMEELRRAVEMGSCVTAAYLASARSLTATVHAIVEGALSLVQAEQSTVFLWNKRTRKLEAAASRGERPTDETGLTFSSGEGIVGRAFESREPQVTSNLKDEPGYRNSKSAIRSLLATPLQTIKGEVIGVLTISRLQGGTEFGEEEVAIVSTFAHRASYALRAAESHDISQRRNGPRAEAA